VRTNHINDLFALSCYYCSFSSKNFVALARLPGSGIPFKLFPFSAQHETIGFSVTGRVFLYFCGA
jgi:hypothetical protein